MAAPGPLGWRYFGRANELDTDREAFRVDHVVDREWNLVRFRWNSSDGSELMAIPSGDGVEVRITAPTGERTEFVSDVRLVWSASPSSLLVLDRLLGTSSSEGTPAVRLEPSSDARPIVVRVTPVGTRQVATPTGTALVREVDIGLDGRRMGALLRSDLPLRADGWFELVE